MMSQRMPPETPERNTHSENRAAPDPANVPIGPDLAAIIERWVDVKVAIVTLVQPTDLFASQE